MKLNNKKVEWKKRDDFEEQGGSDAMRKRKKERRDKYKHKNQKVHQFGYEPEDEYGGMF